MAARSIAAIAVQRGDAPATLALTNTDTMLGGHEGTYAAKTGFTLAAGPCVATAVNRDDMVGRLAFRQDGAVLREGDLVATGPLKVS